MSFDEVLARQRGIFHADQAQACGVSRAAVRHRVATRRWQLVLPRVFAAFSGELTDRQRLQATLLYAGDDALLSGGSALHLYGVRAATPLPALALVPAGNQRASTTFVVLSRTERIDDHAREIDGLRVSSVARAVAEAARRKHVLTEVRALLAEAVQGRLTTVDRVEAELAAGARNGSRLLRVALDD
ncbi:MAG: hypothetical protein ABR520_09065, partial [Mycobacteriales bacterium]